MYPTLLYVPGRLDLVEGIIPFTDGETAPQRTSGDLPRLGLINGGVAIQTWEFAFRAHARHQNTLPTETSLWGSPQVPRGRRLDAYFFLQASAAVPASGNISYLLFILLICSLTLFQTSPSPPHPRPKLEGLKGRSQAL